jgi:hypothetical protein
MDAQDLRLTDEATALTCRPRRTSAAGLQRKSTSRVALLADEPAEEEPVLVIVTDEKGTRV